MADLIDRAELLKKASICMDSAKTSMFLSAILQRCLLLMLCMWYAAAIASGVRGITKRQMLWFAHAVGLMDGTEGAIFAHMEKERWAHEL